MSAKNHMLSMILMVSHDQKWGFSVGCSGEKNAGAQAGAARLASLRKRGLPMDPSSTKDGWVFFPGS